MDNIAPLRMAEQIITYLWACYSFLLLINNLKLENLESRFLGQCVALVKQRRGKKQFLSHVLLCNHLVPYRGNIAATCRLYRNLFWSTCLWLLLSPSPLLLSCDLVFFLPFADHPRTPAAGCGGEFGKSCSVSIRAVSYVLKIPALIVEDSDGCQSLGCVIIRVYLGILNLSDHAVSFTCSLAETQISLF